MMRIRNQESEYSQYVLVRIIKYINIIIYLLLNRRIDCTLLNYLFIIFEYFFFIFKFRKILIIGRLIIQ